ncbi:MAG: 2-C-methyl-D-erythritol 4-phosphate cytidylyltransferase [Nitrospinota bacterium]
MHKTIKTVAIIPAAGIGRRMGGVKKQFLEIDGTPVITETLTKFELSGNIDTVIPVIRGEDLTHFKTAILGANSFSKIHEVVVGGEERQVSVSNALERAGGYDIILVHDGVRPFVTVDMINNAVDQAKIHGAVVTAIPLKDTIKEVSCSGQVVKTLDREALFRIQTPQAFKRELLMSAFTEAKKKGITGTDESSLLEVLGFPIKVIPGAEFNLKITTQDDLWFCKQKGETQPGKLKKTETVPRSLKKSEA